MADDTAAPEPANHVYPFDLTVKAPKGGGLPPVSPMRAGDSVDSAAPVPHRSVDLPLHSSSMESAVPMSSTTGTVSSSMWSYGADGPPPASATANTRPLGGGAVPGSTQRRRPRTSDGIAGATRRRVTAGAPVSHSFSGAYSRKPALSTHRRSKVTAFSTAKRQLGALPFAVDSPLKLKPGTGLGKQAASHLRSSAVVSAPTATREEAGKVHPACQPTPAGTAEVGPGRYRQPDSVGPQLLSTKRSSGATVFPTASRNATAGGPVPNSPGPVYAPRYDYRSQSMRPCDVKFPLASRKSAVPVPVSPGPVYDAKWNGRNMPKFTMPKSKRPDNVSRSYTNELYDVGRVFSGHQRRQPAFGFSKAKRF